MIQHSVWPILVRGSQVPTNTLTHQSPADGDDDDDGEDDDDDDGEDDGDDDERLDEVRLRLISL